MKKTLSKQPLTPQTKKRNFLTYSTEKARQIINKRPPERILSAEKELFSQGKPRLGSGGEAVVFRYSDKTILKCPHNKTIPIRTDILDSLKKHKHHFCIPHTKGLTQFQDYQGRDLFSYVESFVLGKEEGSFYDILFPRLINLCKGISILHCKLNFIFGDIKLENVANKILDLDSISKKKDRVYLKGTYIYMHPQLAKEVFQFQNSADDIRRELFEHINSNNFFAIYKYANNLRDLSEPELSTQLYPIYKNQLQLNILEEFNYFKKLFSSYKIDHPNVNACLKKIIFYHELYLESTQDKVHTNPNIINLLCKFWLINNIHKLSPDKIDNILHDIVSKLPHEQQQRKTTQIKTNITMLNQIYRDSEEFETPIEHKKTYDIYALSLCLVATLLCTPNYNSIEKDSAARLISYMLDKNHNKQLLERTINNFMLTLCSKPKHKNHDGIKVIEFILENRFLSEKIAPHEDSANNLYTLLNSLFLKTQSDRSSDSETSHEDQDDQDDQENIQTNHYMPFSAQPQKRKRPNTYRQLHQKN